MCHMTTTSTTPPPAIFVGARVDGSLARKFALATRLRGETVSAALRDLMRLYIEQAAAQTATPEPLGGPRRQRDSLTATDDNNDRTEDDRVPSG
jgi:hypothetical protein